MDTKNKKVFVDGVPADSAAGTMPPTEKKKKSKRRMKIALVASVHVIAASAIVGLSVALAFMQEKVDDSAQYQQMLESVYSRSYYDLTDGANDIDVTLNKLRVAATKEEQTDLLNELWNSATLTGAAMQSFAYGEDDGLRSATKFVNQLGDYSKALSNKLAEGKSLDADDKATLDEMRRFAIVLKDALSRVRYGIERGEIDLGVEIGADFAGAFDGFVEPDVNYPEMIYDGPFSDALKDREVKFLVAFDEADEQSASVALSALDGFESVKNVGECNGDIATYDYMAAYNGNDVYASVSKRGARLVRMSGNASANHAQTNGASTKECVQRALEFASDAGYENLECVWQCVSGNAAYLNLAPVENGVVLYPDLIKVKIDLGTNSVIGFDAQNFCFNHCERTLDKVRVDEMAARSVISLASDDAGRLCLIPVGETREVLCWEFVSSEDGTYYIYVNALNGREQNILFVVEDEDGAQKLI